MEQVNQLLIFPRNGLDALCVGRGRGPMHNSETLLHLFVAGPPKALDEDETEFLDKLETVRLSFMCILLFARFLLRDSGWAVESGEKN